MTVQTLTDDAFDAQVLKSQGVVVVDFWAPWCGPCKALAPMFEHVSDELDSKATFYKMNIDEHPKAAGAFQVRAIPTLIIFKDGKMIEARSSFFNPGDLKSWIESHLA